MSKFSPSYFMVRVRALNGTYLTDTINGHKASCTAGEEAAARALGRKVFALADVQAWQVDGGTLPKNHSETWWAVHAWKPEHPVRPGKQSGLALETLLLVMGGAVAMLVGAGVVVFALAMVALIKMLGEME